MATRSPLKKRARSGDAAHNITGECERLFCETLRAVFLVERDGGLENSLVMGAQHEARMGGHAGAVKSPGVNAGMPIRRMAPPVGNLPTPSPSPDGLVYAESAVLVREYMEVYDYHATGTCFRGFVAEKNGERAMFAFFDKDVIGQDLKPGYVTLSACVWNSADL